MQSQLEEAFAKWNDSLARNEFFHSELYAATRTLGDHVGQLHAGQHALATNRTTAKPAEDATTAVQAKAKMAQESVATLRSKLEESEKLPRTEGGMPQRLAAQPAQPAEQAQAAEAAQASGTAGAAGASEPAAAAAPTESTPETGNAQ
jgi:hypothetical protein